jgi:hypothetical protein
MPDRLPRVRADLFPLPPYDRDADSAPPHRTNAIRVLRPHSLPYATVMSGFVPQPDLRGCRLGIEIEIQIEIVIRDRVGQFDFDFDADFDFDDDQVGVRLCGSEADTISKCLLGTLYSMATCDCPAGTSFAACNTWTSIL